MKINKQVVMLPSRQREPISCYRKIEHNSTILKMKKDIHPQYHEINVTCSCGNVFQINSTLSDDFSIEVCSACHPFYTGQQKIVDTAGRVDKFRQRYGKK